MMYLSPLMVDFCSVLDEQLADILMAFLPSNNERSRGDLSKLIRRQATNFAKLSHYTININYTLVVLKPYKSNR
jgi:hypothetical protein